MTSKAESKTRRKAGKPKKEGSGSSRTPVVPPPVQYPFPATSQEEVMGEEKRVPQMRTAKARDGGRTQSGGVKGILMDEDDF